MDFFMVSMKITTGNKIIFGGHVTKVLLFSLATALFLAETANVTLIFGELFLIVKYRQK
jgi:hypothetical protein